VKWSDDGLHPFSFVSLFGFDALAIRPLVVEWSSSSRPASGWRRIPRHRKAPFEPAFAVMSQLIRRGDAAVAFSLLQRRRALAGIAEPGWTTRLGRGNVRPVINRAHVNYALFRSSTVPTHH
jgi:hypothetical protein